MSRSRPWRLRTLGRRPVTRWLLAFAMLMLLGQQAVMATYACAMPPATMGAVMAMPASAAMATMGES